MHRIMSMLLTLLCAIIILGVGYFVIVESGKSVLEKERTLEEASYENTSSNIFYGKIEEDIELFPWNYYPEDGRSDVFGTYPRFYAMTFSDDMGEEELKAWQNWYLCQMIAFCSGASVQEVWNLYENGQKNIMDSMTMVENSSVGYLYFYQDILDLNGKQYQVRIACSGWNIISFVCVEYSEEKSGDKKQWEEGKEKLVALLEDSEEDMREYFDYMNFIGNQELTAIYDEKSGYVNMYLQSFHWLKKIIDPDDSKDQENSKDQEEQEEILEEILRITGGWNAMDTEGEKIIDSANKEGYDDDVTYGTSSYSYQILELKNMILLLMQGEETLGIYYDPIHQRFCGYNYFYEY